MQAIEINGETIPYEQIVSAEATCEPEERPFQGDMRRFKAGREIVTVVELKDGRVLTEVKDNPNYEWE